MSTNFAFALKAGRRSVYNINGPMMRGQKGIVMKLIIAIVQDEDAGRLISSLMKEGYVVTKLATTGGFLRAGNTTLLLGVEDEKLEHALEFIESICKSRKQMVSANSTSLDISMNMGMSSNIEIMVGGATVFVLDVVKFSKF